MKPLNYSSDNCEPQSSNCVIWQGPDIECIKLCTGDTISDVVYNLATELCKIMDTMKISNYDLSCFNLLNCPPADYAELIQLLIDKICQLEGVKTEPASSSGECPNDCIVTIEECLITGEQTTMNLVEYVTLIAQKVCSLVNDIAELDAAINALNVRVTILEEATPPSFVMPSFEIQCNLSDPDLMTGDSGTLTEILTALVNDPTYGYCAFRTLSGTNAELISGISKKCILDANLALSDPAFGSMLTYYAADWVTDGSQTTIASAINNLWISLCDVRTYLETYKLEGLDTSTIDMSVDIVGGGAVGGTMAYNISAKIIDTGWQDLEGFTYQIFGAPQVRRIGNVVHFRGDVYIPLADGAAVRDMPNVNSYWNIPDANTAIGFPESISLGADGRNSFNNGASVIPISIMDATTNFEHDVRLGGNGVISTREISAGTGTTVLSAYMEAGITSDGLLYYRALNDIETNPLDTLNIGETSALRYITTFYDNSYFLRDFREGTNGTLHGGVNTLTATGQAITSGTLVIGQAYYIKNYTVGDDFTNVGAAVNAAGQFFIATGTTPTSWIANSELQAVPTSGTDLTTTTPPFTAYMANARTMGGLRFCLDGMLAYIDPCTTDIATPISCP